ncbi:MAG TPA: hypothetical protein VN923_02425, partial [Thermoanaerobaculia bacterium]|nr:hypothetical protein [Thermoanaerobaculia bacterium]
MSRAGRVTASLLVLCALPIVAAAQAPAGSPSPPAAAASANPASAATAAPAAVPAPTLAFDPEAATREWLAKVPPKEKERSDAYFEGGYWLQLWGFLYGLAVSWLLLGTGISRRLRELAQRT